MLESVYQSRLIRMLEKLFPGIVVLKNDTGLRQGFPDLTLLYRHKWAVLEVKASSTAPEQPNQRHYVSMLNDMSYSAFIYPANEDEVLDDLQQLFTPER